MADVDVGDVWRPPDKLRCRCQTGEDNSHSHMLAYAAIQLAHEATDPQAQVC